MKYLKLVMLPLICALAFGCTATKQTAATDTASIEWRLKTLEENFLNFREEQRRQADQSAEQRAQSEARFVEMETQLAALKAGETLAEDMTTSPDDSAWVTELQPEEAGGADQETKAPDTQNPTAESAEEKPWAQVPGPPPVIPEPTIVQRNAATPPVKATPATPRMSGAKAMYDTGLAKYNAGDLEGARGVFDELLKKYPNSDLAPNALYWKGETYYSQKDYAQAILTFKEVTGRFPRHHKSAAALLKIGMSYDNVSDPDNAIFYLRALVEDFPMSEAAKKARKELNRLGG